MNCPVCKMEMQKGFFADKQVPVQWIPEGGKYPTFKGGKAKDSIVFGDGALFWGGYKAEAWYCPCCRMAIVPGK